MELTVFWTNSAVESLEIIFDYYKSKVGLKVAQDIVKNIVDKTILLEKHEKLGQIEELLIGRKNEYRYLVEGNYKMIYWIEEPYLKIATVFDCRQNPIKMKTIK